MKNPLHDIFVPEAEDNLLILEDRIIGIEKDPENQEILNEAFRAIHSIKGGAGLAGFEKIKNFAHIAEDLFELIRSREIKIDKNLISVLLIIPDILKAMIDNISTEMEEDAGIDLGPAEKKIRAILKNQDRQPAEAADETLTETGAQDNYYYLDLSFHKDIFKTGLGPDMFLRDLNTQGEFIALQGISNNFPEPEKFDPERLYLSWKAFYRSELTKKEIDIIFSFTADESSIQVSELNGLFGHPEELSEFKVKNKALSGYISLPKAAAKSAESRYRRASDMSGASFIRVPTDKIEHIFNTVSELIISEASLNLLTEKHEDSIPDDFLPVSEKLRDITRMLQEQVTSLRMMSLHSTFDRFKRVVRDISVDMNKKVSLELEGQDTELDKNMIEKLNDPIKHIIRNSLDHGIETEQERKAAGKPPEGQLCLSAYLENGQVIIEIKDDGRGIDREKILKKALAKELVQPDQKLSDGEILNLIFHPGLSTAAKVTDLSGRGVGMDVVKSVMNDLNGMVEVSSTPGTGTAIRLHLPLTLAILDGMLVSAGSETFIIPTLSIIEIFRPQKKELKTISGKGEVVLFRGDYIPLLRMQDIYALPGEKTDPAQAELIVVQSGGIKLAILVDNVMEQHQVVLKSLQENFRKVQYVSSATILGNGHVALIADIQNIVQNYASR